MGDDAKGAEGTQAVEPGAPDQGVPVRGGSVEPGAPDAAAHTKPEATETGEQAEPGAPDLQAELAKARTRADEYLDQWRRTAADLANYRKRVEREREEMSHFACALLLSRLLPVLDDLERAMATLPPDLRRFSWIEGVSLVERKLQFILEGEGLKPIEASGQQFNPERHEAVLREETTAYPDGQVIAELQRGYELQGRVLRPALVKVAVAPPAATASVEHAEPPAREVASSEPSDAEGGASESSAGVDGDAEQGGQQGGHGPTNRQSSTNTK